MRTIFRIVGLGLLLQMWQPRLLRAQESIDSGCRDHLELKDGSHFQGQLTGYNQAGDTVFFTLYSGLRLNIPQTRVRRIVQRCKGEKRSARQYDFDETGWYHHTRGGMLVGQTYGGANKVGAELIHTSGWKFSRILALGLGGGVSLLSPGAESEAASYPVFAELTGWWLPKRISPFATIGGGWAFTGRDQGSRWGYTDDWRGGWLAQALVGYRIGNHFTVQTGLRLQRKYRDWTSTWGPEGGSGTDRILHKRLVVEIGLLL